MITILSSLKYAFIAIYLGMSFAMSMYLAYDLDESIKLKHIIVNVLFPITIIVYPLSLLIVKSFDWFDNNNIKEKLNKTYFEFKKKDIN